jgi:hypothetical protein
LIAGEGAEGINIDGMPERWEEVGQPFKQNFAIMPFSL